MIPVLLPATLACLGDPPPDPGEIRGATYVEPLAKPDFVLTATDGSDFDFRTETDGFVTLLFFGYTHCPDVCPVHMANIASVLDELAPRVANRVKVVMVTTDPARDSLPRLREWLDNFDTGFVGLTGDTATVNRIQRELRMPPAFAQETGDGSYAVAHSAAVVAFTEDNRAHVRYPFGIRQADWAHDIPLLVERDWSGL